MTHARRATAAAEETEDGSRDVSENALKGQVIAGGGCTLSMVLIVAAVAYILYLLFRPLVHKLLG